MGRMPPIKNTAGEGFAVEDAVVALLSCYLLTGVPWPNQRAGTIKALHCQMRQDGWLFDDVIADIDGHDEGFKIACSVKSFPVFGPEGAPIEFVRSTWAQWLSTECEFRRERDQLAIITADHEAKISDAWKGLLAGAKSIPPDTLARRHANQDEPSSTKRAAFASMTCPAQIDSVCYEDSQETARLLASLNFEEHDFTFSNSRSTALAISLCQQALQDFARDRATDLWDALKRIAKETRVKGGTIDLPRLVDPLALLFPLKDHPSFAGDWHMLRTISTEMMGMIPVKVGGLVTIGRAALLAELSQIASQERCAVALGSSGYGKTVLALNWISAEQGATSVWVRGGDLGAPGGLRAIWPLKHAIEAVFQNATAPIRLVLDGLDRCSNENAFGEAALLLKAAMQLNASSRCQVVITCAVDEWERIRRQLLRHGFSMAIEPVQVSEISLEELKSVGMQIRHLLPLIQRPHLRQLLRWPKALDILASHWKEDNDAPTWVTESDFARWFWESAISLEGRISKRGRVARKVAVLAADRMNSPCQLRDFTEEEIVVLHELQKERHIEVDETRETIRFTHDLVADFARVRELHAQGENAVSFLRPRLHSFFWHRAARLYSLDLLEQPNDSGEWEKLFVNFTGKSAEDELAQNLLLEAPIFALNQDQVLNRLWPILAANNGALLQRFLRQFLRVATVPDEIVAERFRDREPIFQLEISIAYRLPFCPYWMGVLRFLHAHCDEVVVLARSEIADTCLLWLRLKQMTNNGMKEAASLAIASARLVYANRDRWYASHHKVSAEQKVCQALLASAPIFPNEVAELALKFSGRRLPEIEESPPIEDEAFESIIFPPLGPPRPWPEGPQTPPADVFSRAFLDGPSATPFLEALPDISAEVIFATLLDIPLEGERDDEFTHDLDERGFDRGEYRFEATLWTTGPFLAFLRVQPDVALPTIIRLVNFATERALELREDYRTPLQFSMEFEKEVTVWRGHQYCYLWHRGHVFGPKAVCCALMALEFWLYSLIDAKEPIEAHLRTIMRESRSIALAPVLVAVGKRQPELFLTSLRPLLAIAELYRFEETAGSPTTRHSLRSPSYFDPESIRKAWIDWMEMPHRKDTLLQLALKNFLSRETWRNAMTEVCTMWKGRLQILIDKNFDPVWLQRLIAQFDPANWRSQKRGSETLIVFEAPPTWPKQPEKERKSLERFEKLALLPFQCEQILRGEVESTEEQIQSWWKDLEVIHNLPDISEERGIRDREDALCGIVAVAVVRHRAWLAADPSREADALTILQNVGATPPPHIFRADISTDRWDNFAAWAISTLWVERPDDGFLRNAIASLAMSERYSVAERVLLIAGENRKQLGPHFFQLLAHTIRYAQLRHIADFEKHSSAKTIDFEEEVRKHIEQFLNHQTALLPDKWKEIRDSRPGRFWGGSMTNSFDFAHINAALSWAADLDNSRSEEERRNWIKYHEQALLNALARIWDWAGLEAASGDQDFGDQQRKWPYSSEEALLNRIATIVARLKRGETHRLLWEPIFALGANGSRWIQCFFHHWLLEAAGRESLSPNLIEQWLAMLDFAENCDTWKNKSWHNVDPWEDLLGFSPFTSGFWREELAPAVKAIGPYLRRWSAKSLRSDHRARTLIYFLKTKAAKPIRLDGLSWLKQYVRIESDYFWSDESTQQAFAGFLQLLYEDHWPMISADPELRDAFMIFALKLTALQHPLGSEILSLAASRTADSRPKQ